MIIVKKEMKEAIATIKRFMKDKENAKILVQSENGEDVKIQAHSQQMISLHILKNQGEDHFSFLANPYEMETLLKGRGVELEMTVDGDKLNANGVSIEINNVPHKNMKALENLQPFKSEKLFLDLLKEADGLLYESEHSCTSFLKLTAKKALAAEPKRIHYYRLDEDFGFKEAYVQKDIVSALAKSLKGSLKHGMFKNAFVVSENDAAFFLIKIDNVANFPRLNNMKPTKMVTSFEVDASLFNGMAKNFSKKKVKEIEFAQREQFLIVDPRCEEFEIGKIEMENVEGRLAHSLFDAETAKGLFSGYNEKIKVEHFQFKNTFGEEGYMWRILTTDKITMAAGITEPNWDIIKVGNN